MNRRKEEGLRNDPLYLRMRRCAEIDDIRQASARKRAAFVARASHLDDCLQNDRGETRENGYLSDGGRGAAVVRACGEGELWRTLFDLAYDTLDERDRRVVDALFSDLRPAVAARIAGTSRMGVYRTITRFRRDLAAAYLAWKMRDRL